MKERSVVHSDPNILGGTPVFVGTRVPVQALIDYIEGGHSLNEFLDDFPTVTREIAIAALEQAKASLIADASAACGDPSFSRSVQTILDSRLRGNERNSLQQVDAGRRQPLCAVAVRLSAGATRLSLIATYGLTKHVAPLPALFSQLSRFE